MKSLVELLLNPVPVGYVWEVKNGNLRRPTRVFEYVSEGVYKDEGAMSISLISNVILN